MKREMKNLMVRLATALGLLSLAACGSEGGGKSLDGRVDGVDSSVMGDAAAGDSQIPDGSTVEGITFEQLPCAQVIEDTICELDLPGGGSYQNPAWSFDSSRLLVTHFDEGYNEGDPTLEIITLTTGEITPITTGVNLPGNSNTWNRSNKIVFAHEPDEGNENVLTDGQGTYVVEGEQAYVCDAAWQSNLTPITNYPDHAWEPALSPEGVWTTENWVVFQDRFDSRILITQVFADYKVRRDQIHLDITSAILDSVKQPVWSPSGKHIIYQGRTGGGPWRLMMVEVPTDASLMAGDGQSCTTELDIEGTDPSFSPDGLFIVYSGGETLEDTLFVVNMPQTAGEPLGQAVKVTPRNDWYEGAPGWSSHGTLIAYESCHGNPDDVGRTSIWIARAPALP